MEASGGLRDVVDEYSANPTRDRGTELELEAIRAIRSLPRSLRRRRMRGAMAAAALSRRGSLVVDTRGATELSTDLLDDLVQLLAREVGDEYLVVARRAADTLATHVGADGSLNESFVSASKSLAHNQAWDRPRTDARMTCSAVSTLVYAYAVLATATRTPRSAPSPTAIGPPPEQSPSIETAASTLLPVSDGPSDATDEAARVPRSRLARRLQDALAPYDTLTQAAVGVATLLAAIILAIVFR